jgi:hypothetical protein
VREEREREREREQAALWVAVAGRAGRRRGRPFRMSALDNARRGAALAVSSAGDERLSMICSLWELRVVVEAAEATIAADRRLGRQKKTTLSSVTSDANSAKPVHSVTMLVSILEPLRVDYHDSLANALLGRRASDVMFAIVKNRAFGVLSAASAVVFSVCFILALVEVISPLVALVSMCVLQPLWMVSWGTWSVLILKMSFRSFDAFFVGLNMLIVAVSGVVVFEDARLQLVWLLGWLGVAPSGVLMDANPFRARTSNQFLPIVVLVGAMTFIVAKRFGGVDEKTVDFLGGRISPRNRLLGSLVNMLVLFTRYLVQTYFFPRDLTLRRGLKLARVSEETAEFILYHGPRRLGVDYLTTMAATHGPECGEAETLSFQGHLAKLVAAAQAEAGEQAGPCILAEIDGLLALLGQGSEQLAAAPIGGGGGGKTVSLLVPSFAPFILDPQSSLAGRLGLPRLGPGRVMVLASTAHRALSMVAVPIAAIACGLSMATAINSRIAVAVIAIPSLFLALFEAPDLNVPLCAHLLKRFATLFTIYNVCTGIVMLWLCTADEVRAPWLCFQLSYLAHLLSDATSARSHVRSNASVNFYFFAAAHVAMAIVLYYEWLPYDSTIHVDLLFGVRFNAFQTAMSLQFVTMIYSVRFATRARASRKGRLPLILIDSIARRRFLPEEAELVLASYRAIVGSTQRPVDARSTTKRASVVPEPAPSPIS